MNTVNWLPTRAKERGREQGTFENRGKEGGKRERTLAIQGEKERIKEERERHSHAVCAACSGHCVIDSSITIFILHCESELQLAKCYKLMHIYVNCRNNNNIQNAAYFMYMIMLLQLVLTVIGEYEWSSLM